MQERNNGQIDRERIIYEDQTNMSSTCISYRYREAGLELESKSKRDREIEIS